MACTNTNPYLYVASEVVGPAAYFCVLGGPLLDSNPFPDCNPSLCFWPWCGRPGEGVTSSLYSVSAFVASSNPAYLRSSVCIRASQSHMLRNKLCRKAYGFTSTRLTSWGWWKCCSSWMFTGNVSSTMHTIYSLLFCHWLIILPSLLILDIYLINHYICTVKCVRSTFCCRFQ